MSINFKTFRVITEKLKNPSSAIFKQGENPKEYMKLTKAQRAGIYCGEPLITQQKFKTIEQVDSEIEKIIKEEKTRDFFERIGNFIKAIFKRRIK